MSQYPEFAFVILHYMAKQETIDCVASILEKNKSGADEGFYRDCG